MSMRTTMVVLLAAIACGSGARAQKARVACDTDNGGLKLPSGFCATVVADDVGAARHIVIAPNGDIFVATANARRGGALGGVVALRDTTGDGKADMRVKFGANGGSGIALRGGYLYVATNDAVLRYTLPAGNLLATANPDTIVRELPAAPGHSAKTIALGHGNDLFVNIGSGTNSCQVTDRRAEVPGHEPCTELETRAGIWRFDVNRSGQTQRDGRRYATGLRNTVALTFNDGLFGLQHGRDQLAQNWGKYFSVAENAEKPAEIFVRIQAGDDYGWPYCFYDREQRRHVLAPEYGGDGKAPGRCASVKQPLTSFPGHWAPNGVAIYRGQQFPARYRGGAFIAFHGSWNRAPLPQAGYNVVFQPMKEGAPAGQFEVFADGFMAPSPNPSSVTRRPVGVAVGPDGSLYISDDASGRIWRISYRGQ